MTLRTIPRVAIGGGLGLVRLPFDAALRFAGERGPAPVMRLMVDRADGTARGAFASLLGDDQLQDEASRKLAAADERARAIRLRKQANARTEQAAERVT